MKLLFVSLLYEMLFGRVCALMTLRVNNYPEDPLPADEVHLMNAPRRWSW